MQAKATMAKAEAHKDQSSTRFSIQRQTARFTINLVTTQLWTRDPSPKSCAVSMATKASTDYGSAHDQAVVAH